MTRKKDRNAWFPFYADDFLAGTLELTEVEVGVYIRLLAISWSKGPLTDRLLRGARADPEVVDLVLQEKFVQTEAGWINERLESEREYKRIQSEAGSKGAAKRQANRKRTASEQVSETPANVLAKRQPHNHSHNHNHTPPPNPRPAGGGGGIDWGTVLRDLLACNVVAAQQALDGAQAAELTPEQASRLIAIYRGKRDAGEAITPGLLVGWLRTGVDPMSLEQPEPGPTLSPSEQATQAKIIQQYREARR